MNIVITGSTQGIGLGLAREFLGRGHDVMISSRRAEAVAATVSSLQKDFPGRSVNGQACDVAEYVQVQKLWEQALSSLGSVDIWVNNAGRDGAKMPFFAIPPEDMIQTINTNLVGIMMCNRVVIPGMYQQKHGKIFNMEGFGSNGMVRPTASVYGTTKCAVRYFTKAVSQELNGTPVKLGYLSPGMVLTDMLVPPPEARGKNWAQSRKFLNILADTVETVTPFLVEGMLRSEGNGDAIRWLTRRKIAWRFLASRFRKRDILSPLGL